MPILMPDTSEAEDLTPSVPGTYRAVISKVGSQKSKEKQNDMVVPTYSFTAPPLNPDPITGKQEPRKVNRRSFLNITGPGSFGFDQLLRTTGNDKIADEIKAHPGQVPFDTDLVQGKEVQVIITNGLYNNKITDNVDSILPV